MVLPFRDFIVADKGGPRLPIFYQITTLHALFGTAGVLFGWFVVLRGHGLVPKALQFSNWKLYMRIAYSLYMIATILGVAVYGIWAAWEWRLHGRPGNPAFARRVERTRRVQSHYDYHDFIRWVLRGADKVFGPMPSAPSGSWAGRASSSTRPR